MRTILQPKQVLKDYCRHRRYTGPTFYLAREEKVDLHKHYTIQVLINDVITAEATGLSRRNAEFKAALNAVLFIGQNDPSILENVQFDAYTRSSFGRSISVDQISKFNRFGSLSSMIPSHFSSASPSIDGIDSLTIHDDCMSYLPLSGAY